MSDHILVVDDSRLMTKVLSQHIRSHLEHEPVIAQSMADAKAVIESGEYHFLAAIMDLNLPDAPHGEAVDLVMSHDIPAIILTSTYSDTKRDQVLSSGAVDYVTKDNRSAYEYVMRLIHRLDLNRSIEALVVDDAKSHRTFVRKLLQLQNFIVHEAEGGQQALEVMRSHPGIKLVISDYNMPDMNGFELTNRLRSDHDLYQLAIIGLSSTTTKGVSARFIKSGANDFLVKPFSHEEFFVRVMQNMDAQEHLARLLAAAERDDLTGLYNWRHFNKFVAHELAHSESSLRCLAVISLDHCRTINDTYGHDTGDEVLKKIAEYLVQMDDNGLPARLGGKEFIVYLPGLSVEMAVQVCQDLVSEIDNTPLNFNSAEIEYTVSIGVAGIEGQGLADAIHDADEALGLVKESGGNSVRQK